MRKLILFCLKLYKKIDRNELIQSANELTYKLLLAIFPFLISLISLLGFFNLNADVLLSELSFSLPEEIFKVIEVFIMEVVYEKHPSILSTGLAVALFSASSGFYTIVRCINRVYDQRETRNYFYVRFLSVMLVLLFALSIIVSLSLLTFSSVILKFLGNYMKVTELLHTLFSLVGALATVFVLLLNTMLIYKIASCKKISFLSTLPGATTAVFCWIVASKLYNVYINNFSRYSAVYGSIGSLFILVLWLNIISFALVVGCQINAMLSISRA